MLIDHEANRAYWQSVPDQFDFDDNLALDFESGKTGFLSPQEHAHTMVGAAFKAAAVGDSNRLNRYAKTARIMVDAALQQQKFAEYHSIDRNAPDRYAQYRRSGLFKCQWYLRILQILDPEQATFPASTPLALIDWVNNRAYSVFHIKSGMDLYGGIWLDFEDYQGFIDMYDALSGVKLRGQIKFSRKTQAMHKYCVAMVTSDARAAQKAIVRQYEKSRVWYDYDVDYPWWDCLTWVQAWQIASGGRTLDFDDLKGV